MIYILTRIFGTCIKDRRLLDVIPSGRTSVERRMVHVLAAITEAAAWQITEQVRFSRKQRWALANMVCCQEVLIWQALIVMSSSGRSGYLIGLLPKAPVTWEPPECPEQGQSVSTKARRNDRSECDVSNSESLMGCSFSISSDNSRSEDCPTCYICHVSKDLPSCVNRIAFGRTKVKIKFVNFT